MIIENSNLQSKTLKSVWLSVTLLMWFLYAYLWLPLISLVAWWFGYQSFTYHMITLNGLTAVETLVADYLLYVVTLCGGLLIWARLEKFRFGNKARRNNIEPINNQIIAKHFNLSEQVLNDMQTKKIITAEFNKEGEITHFQ
ncbi:MAG TPA: poly-beta-1,6-N-acetyl-D-glucosamine biosynthesis protein PgaD [Methylophilaceae bacterium]|nr:poly-beta-1,6-N-acetyl-D-glucosamine biosynthesis protein PgaD [Methylophilaceae bacterium]